VDSPRLLARRSELGYTDRLETAVRDEPEAVDASTQARLTRQAGQKADQKRRQAWIDARQRIVGELEVLRSTFGPTVSNELRNMRRELDRLDSKLAR